MYAPSDVVNLSDGSVVELRKFYSEKPLLLVFLRHFGCIFCREQVAELREYPDLNVVFVTMGTVQEAADFKERTESPHPFVSDPNKTLYAAFTLPKGNFGRLFTPQTIRRGFQAGIAGHRQGRPVGDPWQLAGSFLIGTDGKVLKEHRSKDVADNLSSSTVRSWLSEPATAS